jgi:hypothetical protein
MSVREAVWPTVGFAIMAATLVAYGKWDISLSRAILQQWAAQEGLEILDSRCRSLFRGPFTWNSRKGDAVFLVAARNADGKVRHGWVRVGLAGADVQWKE